MRGTNENLVRLIDPASGIVISGRLEFLSDGTAEVKGVAEGLTVENYQEIRPSDVRGQSLRWGGVWLSRIYNFQPSISSDPSLPAIVRLRAIETYLGDFDPRESQIHGVRSSLGDLASLFHFRPYTNQEIVNRSLTRTYKLSEPPLTLFEGDGIEISLEHLINFGEQVTYKQMLCAEFKNGIAAKLASDQFDSACLLISVLTQSYVVPRTIKYVNSDAKFATEKRALRRRPTPLDPYDWLTDQDGIIALLRKGLVSWMKALAAAELRVLVQWFMTAAHATRTVESKFLLFCQCFEELNRMRIGRCQFDEEVFKSDIEGPMLKAVQSLDATWVTSDMRGRLRAAVKGANDWRLRDRIEQTLNKLPRLKQTVKRGINDIRMRLERRRNALSHGDPLGGVTDQADHDCLLQEISVIRALCLAELLMIAGIEDQEADQLVLQDTEMKLFSWRVSQTSARK
jgi:hypothetical protein